MLGAGESESDLCVPPNLKEIFFSYSIITMSKRANQDPSITSENKRTRKEGHAPECTDSQCEGCDVGQVEISFVRKDAQGQPMDTEPDATELLAMAIDEASRDKKVDNDDENNGMARRLFDMAIEKFQKDEPQNRLGYATCLIELGKAIGVKESISEGLEILRGELKKNNSEEVALKLAGAAIALATFIRKEQDTYFEKQEKELDEDDEVARGELLAKQVVGKEEEKLYKEALEHTKDAFNRLNESLYKEAQSVLYELKTYGLLLVQPFHKDQANAVLDIVSELLKKLPNYEENDELLLLWAACLLHQEKFVEDKKHLEIMDTKIDQLLAKANALYLTKHEKENHYVWEMVNYYSEQITEDISLVFFFFSTQCSVSTNQITRTMKMKR